MQTIKFDSTQKKDVAKTVIMGLRACGPWTTHEIACELLTQSLHVDRLNVDVVTKWVVRYLLGQRIIEQYDDMEGVYCLHSRLYDPETGDFTLDLD